MHADPSVCRLCLSRSRLFLSCLFDPDYIFSTCCAAFLCLSGHLCIAGTLLRISSHHGELPKGWKGFFLLFPACASYQEPASLLTSPSKNNISVSWEVKLGLWKEMSFFTIEQVAPLHWNTNVCRFCCCWRILSVCARFAKYPGPTHHCSLVWAE